MSDLHARLREAITARLELARRACHGGDGAWHQTDSARETGRIEDSQGWVVVFDEGSPSDWQAEHIAANDPARILRDCARDLRMLERHRLCVDCGGGPGYQHTHSPFCHRCYQPAPCDEARDLADEYEVEP